ncbi:MAG: hypothetical protein K2I51_01190, partial [Muribaculaceae bacterium]|nr:hypothetical protein [Muribaculaceae bacterium]
RFTCAKLRPFFELANFSATFFELFLHPIRYIHQITLIISDITSRLKHAASQQKKRMRPEVECTRVGIIAEHPQERG